MISFFLRFPCKTMLYIKKGFFGKFWQKKYKFGLDGRWKKFHSHLAPKVIKVENKPLNERKNPHQMTSMWRSIFDKRMAGNYIVFGYSLSH